MNELLMALIKSLMKNGVKMPGELVFVEDSVRFIGEIDAIILDFSEHDKKVADEKDKRIAELEEMRKHLWEVGETHQRKRLDAEKEASELRKELIAKNKRIVELIAEKNVLKTECCFDRISELEERHSYDCIKIKNLQAALDLITEMYELLKEVHGL